MTKQKTTGTAPGTGRPAIRPKAFLSLSERLVRLGVSPEEVLGRALTGERIARTVKPFDPAAAVRLDLDTVYAPSVLNALASAARRCRTGDLRVPYVERRNPDDSLREDLDGTKAWAAPARRLISEVSEALRSPSLFISRLEIYARVIEAVRLARAVQTEAERLVAQLPDANARSDGRPNAAAVTKARRSVAVNAGLSVEAMQLRILRASEEVPDHDWPPIMPARRGNRHA